MDLALGYMLGCIFATCFVLATTLINGGSMLSNKLLTKLDIDAEPSIKLFTFDCVLFRVCTRLETGAGSQPAPAFFQPAGRRRLFVGLAGENRGKKPPVYRRQKASRRRLQAWYLT